MGAVFLAAFIASERVSAYDTVNHAIANPAGDTWTAQGDHYAEVDYFLVTCVFGCSANHIGTDVYELGESEDSELVCGDSELDELMREYPQYGVNLMPNCDTFASSGASTHFTWSQLNGGFSTGSQHSPWGLVTQRLKNGLDYVASNYANFARISLTSGYRCPHGNALVGGVSNSAHVHGIAADLLRPGWTQAEFDAVKDVVESAGGSVNISYSAYPDHHMHAVF